MSLVGTTLSLIAIQPAAYASNGLGGGPVAIGIASTPDGRGYWIVRSDGGVFSYGDAGYYGSVPGDGTNVGDVVGFAPTPDGKGYWIAEANGGIFTFGDAVYESNCYNSCGTTIIGIAADPAAGDTGYWLLGANGGVFSFGNATYYGSVYGKGLARPATGITPTSDGKGYWIVAADGGVFTFGDANFESNCANGGCGTTLVAIAGHGTNGYWLAGENGGVFTYGSAGFYGSEGSSRLYRPITAIAATPNGGGYWLLGADGGVFSFGNAPYDGSPSGSGAIPRGTGVYGSYGSVAIATTAINDGWSILGDAGGLGTPSSPYTQEVSSQPDANVKNAIVNTNTNISWLSYWTVSWPEPGDTFYNAGFQGGAKAAATLRSYSSTTIPAFIILDPEGYNSPATNGTEWSQFIDGWQDGLASVDPVLTAAYYGSQSQFQSYGLRGTGIPAWVAISPILGNTPSVTGDMVFGYSGYYAGCPAGSYVSTENGWGAYYNTLQFSDSGVDCGP